MVVIVKIQDGEGVELTQFHAEKDKSIAEMAAENNVEIIQSCSEGYCWTCLCGVTLWGETVAVDKKGEHLYELEMDENDNPKQLLACVWGIKDEMIDDEKTYILNLIKTY